ncbi:MAG TPA: hypothetical protein PKE12_05525 [Kiritimatiellia bacterium]|nr:hypothetical protein [Kiritimatiellia bacterium]
MVCRLLCAGGWALALALPGWAGEPGEGAPFQYAQAPLLLGAESVEDGLRTIALQDLPSPEPAHPLRLAGVTPLTERLWRIALSNVESNVVETENGRYFGAGTKFGLRVYTRDISFAGVLGLNQFYPELMKSSLEVTRRLRFKLGLMVSKGYAVPGVDAAWQELDLEEREFLQHYHSNSYTRRTDDVIWLWAASDLFTKHPAIADYTWLYETGRRCFEEFYDPFFDASDGLYRGQATFVDIHFFTHKTGGYPQDFSVQDCVRVKALSLNCLYVRGLETMSQAARQLGRTGDAAAWQGRADALRHAINTQLRNREGYLVYFKDPQGALQERREALGIALAVLLDIVTGDDAKKQLGGYPVTDAGVPLFLPFFEHEARVYHNNAAWPFVDTLFLWAHEKAHGVDRTAENAALLARTCVGNGSFHEVVDFATREPKGSGAQLWSAAAFLNVCYRAGLHDLTGAGSAAKLPRN